MMGLVKTHTGSFDIGYFLMAAFMFIGAVTVLTLKYGLHGAKAVDDSAAPAEAEEAKLAEE